MLDGVKMAAGVWLNGVYLGTMQDQFLRVTFPVRALLAPAGSSNTLVRHGARQMSSTTRAQWGWRRVWWWRALTAPLLPTPGRGLSALHGPRQCASALHGV